jgi:DNA-binding PadR family transcriptional regulator
MINLDACPCSGRNLDRLVKPAALMLLTRQDLHGYELVQRLGDLPMFGGAKPDTTGVYRALRAMAGEGLVTSSWVLSDAGPAKRCYHMTEDGLACARKWVATLKQYHDAVGALLALAEETLAEVSAGRTEGRGSSGTAPATAGDRS